MRRILLALVLLVPAPLAAQNVVVINAQPIEAPAGVERIWEKVQKCAGVTAAPGMLENIKWMVGSIPADTTHPELQPGLAIMLPPDTLVLTPLARRTGWLVAHELLHYLLQTPDHPRNPFMFPCQLMDFQNLPAGIMAAPVRNTE